MIGYLEQLERDLVEAIDRSEAMPARGRRLRRLRPRPDWRRAVAGVAAALLVIALVVAVIRLDVGLPRAGPAPPPAQRSHPKPAPIPPGTPLRLVGDITRVDESTWRGQARGPGGAGTLTLTGTVNLKARPCCDTLRSPALSHTIGFTWTTPRGTVSGCIANTILRRPHGRFVWDGLGQVRTATGALARYRGWAMSIAGETPASSPDETRVTIGGNGREPTPPPRQNC